MVILTALTVALDQLCKKKINENIAENQYVHIAGERIYITNVKNRGMAMGLFAEKDKLLSLSSIIGILLVVLMWIDALINRKNKLYKTATALIAGGGISNVYDRFVKKEVTDYIYYKKGKMPVFNIADAAIFLGAALSIVDIFRKKN